jgi:hypothetical protein
MRPTSGRFDDYNVGQEAPRQDGQGHDQGHGAQVGCPARHRHLSSAQLDIPTHFRPPPCAVLPLLIHDGHPPHGLHGLFLSGRGRGVLQLLLDVCRLNTPHHVHLVHHLGILRPRRPEPPEEPCHHPSTRVVPSGTVESNDECKVNHNFGDLNATSGSILVKLSALVLPDPIYLAVELVIRNTSSEPTPKADRKTVLTSGPLA